MPKLWNHTIEAHHRDVRDAILDAAARLLTTHAARGVTMMRIAQEAGIGRATLYKYFPDIEAILIAWHERHIAEHLKHLAQLCETPGPPEDPRRAVKIAHLWALENSAPVGGHFKIAHLR